MMSKYYIINTYRSILSQMNYCKTSEHSLLNFVDDTHNVQRGESCFHFCVVFVQPLKKNIYKFERRRSSCFRKTSDSKTAYYHNTSKTHEIIITYVHRLL